MNLLGIDFETQCDDAKNTLVTEVGAVLKARAVPGLYNGEWLEAGRLASLTVTPEHKPQTPEIVELTGITDEDLRARGRPLKEVFLELLPLVERATVVAAHNKKFDKTVFEATCARLGLNPPEREWLCTYTEVPYPKKYKCKKLAHLALDHGLKMDNRELHRADNDVDLMLELLLHKYNIDEVLAYAREPWIVLKADVLGPWQGKGGDGGIGTGQAKGLGYSYETPRAGPERTFPKSWVKCVKQREVEAEKLLAPFRVAVLG